MADKIAAGATTTITALRVLAEDAVHVRARRRTGGTPSAKVIQSSAAGACARVVLYKAAFFSIDKRGQVVRLESCLMVSDS